MRPFNRFPRAVTREFRDLHMDLYPALAGDTQEALTLRRMAEYAEFGPLRWSEDEGIPELLCSRQILAGLAGLDPDARGFSAERLLDSFSAKVYPLHVSDYRYSRRQARVIRPAIPDAVQQARRTEISPELRPTPGRVDFVTGDRLPPRRHRAALAEYQARLETAAEIDAPHPARDLLRLLNSQPPQIVARLVREENGPQLYQAWSRMPVSSEREREQRDAVFRVLSTVQDFPQLVYAEAANTPRLHAQGNSIHLLPRHLRKLALMPACGLDLKACQLAVVARLWHIERLEAFLRANLEGGPSIWDELLGYLGFDASYKSTIKRAIYPIVFGMARHRVRTRLAMGIDDTPGIGAPGATLFFQHPLIADLLEARGEAKKAARRARGVEDAFGRWLACGPSDIRSVLALQAQSYELRLMLSVLPVIRAERDVRVVSFLHDGMTVWVTDERERGRKLKRIRRAVANEAESLNIATELETEDAVERGRDEG